MLIPENKHLFSVQISTCEHSGQFQLRENHLLDLGDSVVDKLTEIETKTSHRFDVNLYSSPNYGVCMLTDDESLCCSPELVKRRDLLICI